MKPLKRGSKGPSVRKWQVFLRGSGFPIVADGDFGPKTHKATLEFQKRHGLVADGIVGNQTLGAAMLAGHEVVPPGGTGKKSAAWPPVPTNVRFLGAAQRASRFGSFEFVPAPSKANPEGIKITQRLGGFKIVNVQLPQLVGVTGFPKSGNVFFHAEAAAQLVELVGAWSQAGLLPLVKSWAGSYVPRFIRGSRTALSNHSWGTAFDINAAWNGLGRRPPLVGQAGSVRELVQLANKHGFYWGGHFGKRPDGMHFEVGRKV